MTSLNQSSFVKSIPVRPYTPAEVLALFRAQHAGMREVGLASLDVELTFETTVEQWALELDLGPCSNSGAVLARWFEFDYVADDWKRLLSPPRKRKLRGICEYVASRARVPVFKTVQVFGVRDRKAGIFLTLKELLRACGADVSELGPSSRLTDYSHRGFPELSTLLRRSSPHLTRIAHARYRDDFAYLITAAVLLASSAILAAWGSATSPVYVLLSILAFCLFLWTLQASKRASAKPASVEFKGLETFRDLCEWFDRPVGIQPAPHCPKCAYPLTGLTHSRCPECGRTFTAEEFGMTDEDLRASLEAAVRSDDASPAFGGHVPHSANQATGLSPHDR